MVMHDHMLQGEKMRSHINTKILTFQSIILDHRLPLCFLPFDFPPVFADDIFLKNFDAKRI